MGKALQAERTRAINQPGEVGLARKVRVGIHHLRLIHDVVTLHLNQQTVVHQALRETEVDLIAHLLGTRTVTKHNLVVVAREPVAKLVRQHLKARSCCSRSTHRSGHRIGCFGYEAVGNNQIEELLRLTLRRSQCTRNKALYLRVGTWHDDIECHRRLHESVGQVDKALHRHSTSGTVCTRERTCQEWLQRRLQLIYRVDVEYRIQRITRPLNSRAWLNIKPLVDYALQGEEVASLLDGVVAIHLKDIGLRVDAHIDLSLARTLDDIADGRVDNQLSLGVRANIQRKGNIHSSVTRRTLFLTILEDKFLTCKERRSIALLLSKGYEVGSCNFAIVGQWHEELGIVVAMGHEIHLHTRLIATHRTRSCSEDLTVEHRIILLSGVEHLHIVRLHVDVVLDIREVSQRHIQRQGTLVSILIEHRHLLCHEAIVLHLDRSLRSRVTTLCIVDCCCEAIHLNLTLQLGHSTLTADVHIHRSNTLRARNDTRQHRVKQAHLHTLGLHTCVVAHLRRGKITLNYASAILASGDIERSSATTEVPTRYEQQVRNRNSAHAHAIHLDTRLDSAILQYRVDGSVSVCATIYYISDTVGNLSKRSQREVAQVHIYRVLVTARSYTIDIQLLRSAAHCKTADIHTRRVHFDTVSGNLPRSIVIRKRRLIERNEYVSSIVPARELGIGRNLTLQALQRVCKDCIEANIVILSTAMYIYTREVEGSRIEILSHHRHRQRVTHVSGSQIQICCEVVAVHHILGRSVHHKALIRWADEHLHLRALSNLQALGYTAKQRVDILGCNRENCNLVTNLCHLVMNIRTRRFVVEERDILHQEISEVVYHILIRCTALEHCISKVRLESHRARILITHKCELNQVSITSRTNGFILGICHTHHAIHSIERLAACRESNVTAQHRNRISLVDTHRVKVSSCQLHNSIVLRFILLYKVDNGLSIELQSLIISRKRTCDVVILDIGNKYQVLIVITLKG